jgi:hypothetical protein
MAQKKLVLLESEMTHPNGHFFDYLIETTLYFQNKFKIIWFLNKNCEFKNAYIPCNAVVKKVIISNNYRRKENKLFYFIEEVIFLLKNIYYIFYFTLFFIKKKKFKNFIKTLISNYFIIPKYFKSFYFELINCQLNENDNIFVLSCRRKDISCIYFFSNIEEFFPKIHLRVFYPPKKKFKSFFFYLSKLEKFILKKQIFLYVDHEYTHKLISKEMRYKNLLHNTIPFHTFSEKFFNNRILTIGFVGQARRDKGFHFLPALITELEKKIKLNYLIQFTSTNEMSFYEKQLFNMSNNNPRIKIVKKYCNHEEYRNILKKIDVMPILHDLKRLDAGSSGVIYSCIANEISLVIPKDCSYLKKILVFKSFEEAIDINGFVKKIILINNKFDSYLKEAKKLSKNFNNNINDSVLIKNLN